MTNKEYWYWLCNIDGIGNRKIKSLLRLFPSPEAVYFAKERELSYVQGLKHSDIQMIKESKQHLSEKIEEYSKLKSVNIKFVTVEDNEYPKRLKNIYDSPYALYVKGNIPEDSKPTVAIIGARNCSNYGKEMAYYYGKELAGYGIQIISGMAMGIDSYGQWGALESGNTFAILGSGIDVCYPKQNIELYMKLQQKGGVISEYGIGKKPLPYYFPMRNRIISGLSDCIVVIEAKQKSGSFITVDQALEQGKEVFALPGRVSDALSLGCNELIKNGANMLLNTEEILEFFHISQKNNGINEKKIKKMLAKEEKIIYSCLSLEPKHVDVIIQETKLSFSNVISILIQLELEGMVIQPIKNHYTIVPFH